MNTPLTKQGQEFFRWSKKHPVGEIPAGVAKEGAGENRIPFTHLANSVPVYLYFAELLRKQKKGKLSVLDVGCGTGRNISFVKDVTNPSNQFFGIDYSRACIDYARSQYGNHGVVYTQHEGTILPFPDNTFDFIVSSHVLEHIPKQHAATYVKEIGRILKKGGVAVIGTPNRAYCQDLFAKNPKETRKYRLVLPHLHEYYAKEIVQLFKNSRAYKKLTLLQTTNAICRKLMTDGANAIKPGKSLFSTLKFEVYSVLRQNSMFQDMMARFGSEILIKRMNTTYNDLLSSTILRDTHPEDGDNFIMVAQK